MWRTIAGVAALASGLGLAGCGDDEPDVSVSGGAAEPSTAPEAAEEPASAPEAAADPTEACAQVLVVAWQGAQYAAEDITRSKDEARARAEELRQRLAGGADFAELARAESDAASTAPRGGMIGTYTRDDWPRVHGPIEDTVFALPVGGLSEVVEAPYGWVIARRCPVEKVHTRHILIRYRGARDAPADVTRGKDEARRLAEEVRGEVTAPDADFAAIARERSEDGSAARGGDLGLVGRGRLAPAYEEAAFTLAPGEVSGVVETEFGFHVIQRVE